MYGRACEVYFRSGVLCCHEGPFPPAIALDIADPLPLSLRAEMRPDVLGRSLAVDLVRLWRVRLGDAGDGWLVRCLHPAPKTWFGSPPPAVISASFLRSCTPGPAWTVCLQVPKSSAATAGWRPAPSSTCLQRPRDEQCNGCLQRLSRGVYLFYTNCCVLYLPQRCLVGRLMLVL